MWRKSEDILEAWPKRAIKFCREEQMQAKNSQENIGLALIPRGPVLSRARSELPMSAMFKMWRCLVLIVFLGDRGLPGSGK